MLSYDLFALAGRKLAELELDWYPGYSQWTWIEPPNVSTENVLVGILYIAVFFQGFWKKGAQPHLLLFFF